MKTGIALWLFPEMTLPENIAFFAGKNFEAVSLVGRHVEQLAGETGDRIVHLLELHHLALTVHHKLPDPEDADARERFGRDVEMLRRWHGDHRLLTGLTFDMPKNRGQLLDDLRHVLETFADTDIFICCEDFPLNEEQRLLLDGLDETYPNLGILIDLGHLNLRVTKEDPEQDMAAAVRRHLRAVPLTIRELHVHNNDGLSDQHQRLGVGTLPVEAAAAQLREIGFDGISTTEFVPEWNDIHGREAYDLAIDAARQWELLLGDNA